MEMTVPVLMRRESFRLRRKLSKKSNFTASYPELIWRASCYLKELGSFGGFAIIQIRIKDRFNTNGSLLHLNFFGKVREHCTPRQFPNWQDRKTLHLIHLTLHSI